VIGSTSVYLLLFVAACESHAVTLWFAVLYLSARIFDK